MTEREYDAAIEETKLKVNQLETERRSLREVGWNMRKFCPRPTGASVLDRLEDHEWTVISTKKRDVFGDLVRVVEYECQCGATMMVTGRPDRE